VYLSCVRYPDLRAPCCSQSSEYRGLGQSGEAQALLLA
jgi:hypothetical protein